MKLNKLPPGDKKRSFGIYIILLLGVALLALGSLPNKKPEAEAKPAEKNGGYMELLEARLSKTLSEIDGAGRVEVMLVAENDGSIAVQQDGSGESSKTVVISGPSGSEALVLAENAPSVRGALIVAEGGGSDRVRADLAEAASTALGIGAHRVKVYKMRQA